MHITFLNQIDFTGETQNFTELPNLPQGVAHNSAVTLIEPRVVGLSGTVTSQEDCETLLVWQVDEFSTVLSYTCNRV